MNIVKQHRAFEGTVKFVEHDSVITKTTMRFSMFLPTEKPRGCLLWLSGLTCNEENFITKAGALSYLSEHRLMLVCPDTSPRGLDLPNEHETWDFGSGASFYVNASTEGYIKHYRMQSYLIEELCPLICNRYPVKEHFAILGHSMGGHGALTIGLRYPDYFSSISAFAPIVHPSACGWGKKAFKGYLGEERSTWRAYDACHLIEDGNRHSSPILISQGTEDEFLNEQLLTEDFVQACHDYHQPLQVDYCQGFDHSYFFISSFIKQHIDFHLGYF